MKTQLKIKSQDTLDIPWGEVYFWLFSYLKKYRKELTLLMICGIVTSLSEIIIPKSLQYFFDVILPSKEYAKFGMLIGIVAAVLVLIFIFTAWQTILQRKLGENAASDIQLAAFQHLRKLGLSYYEENPVGDTHTLLNEDISHVRGLFRDFLPNIMVGVLVLLIALIFLIHTSPILSMILIPCLILYLLAIPLLGKKNKSYEHEMTRMFSVMGKRAFDTVSAVPELRAYDTQEWDITTTLKELAYHQMIHLLCIFYLALIFTLRTLCANLGTILMFIYGSVLVQKQLLSVGEFIAFTFYFFIVLNNFMMIVGSLSEQRMIMLHVMRIFTFMRRVPDIQEPAISQELAAIQGAIEFSDVDFTYKTGGKILHNFNLNIQPGEKVALVGESGNGKTTILKLIPRFYDPDAGEIRLDGIPINQLSFEQLRSAIGFVFQETYLYGHSVMENIRFGNLDATDEQVEEAAKAAYAHDFILELPEGYQTLVGERGIRLSGGQKQRIAIARMFVQNPKIILLDEATSALDNLSEREVQSALDHLLEGRTTVTVAHRLSTIRQYDRILFIQDGSIQEEGDYDTLLQKQGHFHQLAIGSKL